MNCSISEISDITGGQLIGNSDATIRYILTDSRSLMYPASTLFFAIRGERNDGHDYIVELYCRGVRCFVAEKLPDKRHFLPDAAFVLVSK